MNNGLMRFRDGFLLFIRGVLIGVSNLLPFVSNGTIMVSLGIYDSVMLSIGNFSGEYKRSLRFLVPLFLGCMVGLFSGYRLVSFLFKSYDLPVILFFIGLSVGGIYLINEKEKLKYSKKNVLLFLLSLVLVLSIHFLILYYKPVLNLSFFYCLVFGVFCGMFLFIPGICFLKIIEPCLGYYSGVSSIFSFIGLAFGVIIGIFTISKVVCYMFSKRKCETNYIICGFVFASIIILLLQIKTSSFSFINIMLSIISFIWGYNLAKNLIKE